MRLLPHNWEGLHPAFPQISSPSESCVSVGPPINAPLVPGGHAYGMFAFVCVAASAKRTMSLGPKRGIGMLVKTTVFATALGVANTINGEVQDRSTAPVFLRSRHIEPPKFEFADRLSHWDSDNWSILGGAAGLLLASGRGCPLPTVSQPLWFAVHALSGIWLADLGHACQEAADVGAQDVLNRMRGVDQNVLHLQKASYSPEVTKELLLSKLSSLPVPLHAIAAGQIKVSPDIIAGLKTRQYTKLMTPQMAASAINSYPAKSILDLILHPPNESDEIHKTYTPPGEEKPVPYATRNYDWSGSPQDGQYLLALENHIASLRKQRQQTCDEAEALRAWLHEREAQYYGLKSSPNSEPAALRSEKIYLEFLSQWYKSTWTAVSECDWMISDTTDHLALARAIQQGQQWPPSNQPGKPSSIELKHMLQGLDVHLQRRYGASGELRVIRDQHRKLLKITAKENHRSRKAIEDRIRLVETLQNRYEEENEVARRVLSDAFARSKPVVVEKSECTR